MKEKIFEVPGIPDEYFDRGNLPMTKEEVRCITVSKLRLSQDSIVYDVGAGTGTVSIEAGFIVKKGKVYSIEKTEEGCELIQKNTRKFRLHNIEVIKGEAPEVLKPLPAPHRVFIGGSGGRLKEILKVCHQKLRKNGIIVINCITIETLTTAVQVLKEKGYSVEIVNIAVSKGEKAGKVTMMRGLNPVFIISARKGSINND